MKILYLAARQPYPVIKGDQIIAYEQIKELSKKHDIYLVTFFEDTEEEFLEEMKKYCKKIWKFKQTKISKIISSIKVLINGKPIQMNIFFKGNVKREMDIIYSEIKPDIVHVQSFRMAEYFMDNGIKKSIDLIDSYSANMYNRAKSSLLLKPLWYLEYKLLSKYENEIINKYEIKTLVSDRDLKFFEDKSILVNNNGTSIKFSENISCENNIIIQGNMSYYPNVEAVEYIINNLLNELKRVNPNLKLYIVGGNPNNKIEKFNNDNDVIVTGYVKNIEDYMERSKVAIYPIFSATGMQNKVLEAMAAGVPCIISQQCVDGINDLKHNENVLVANDREDYIKYYELLINNDIFYNKIRNNARKLIEKKYSWESNCEKLEAAWNKK